MKDKEMRMWGTKKDGELERHKDPEGERKGQGDKDVR